MNNMEELKIVYEVKELPITDSKANCYAQCCVNAYTGSQSDYA